MARKYDVGQDLSIDPTGFSLEDVRSWSLDELARNGAKLILETALREEVLDLLGRDRYERDCEDALPGYLNGYRVRKVRLGSGEVEVRAQKVTGTATPYRSDVLPAFALRSEALDEVLPLLYAEGLSTRDFKRALKPLWNGAGLSRSAISRANEQLRESFKAWRRRDLGEVELVYLFLDAVMLKVRIGSYPAEAVLVAHGVCRDGSRAVLGLMLGGRESTDSWKAFLHDLTGRGLHEPSLVISDGNGGLIRAVKDIWPNVARQRCIAHKIRNVLARVPKKDQATVKRAVTKIFYAADLDEAKQAAIRFIGQYGKQYAMACETLCRDLYDCLTFYQFPQAHWKRLRTSNVIERAFREVRRRTRVVGRFPNELSALTLVFVTLEEDRLKWRGLRMDDELLAEIEEAGVQVKKKEVFMIKAVDTYLEAA
jgi:transposase-like protein